MKPLSNWEILKLGNWNFQNRESESNLQEFAISITKLPDYKIAKC